jgi:hypothetical protein
LFGGAVARAWEKMKIGVIRARQQLKDPTIYYYFEYLQRDEEERTKTLAIKNLTSVLAV